MGKILTAIIAISLLLTCSSNKKNLTIKSQSMGNTLNAVNLQYQKFNQKFMIKGNDKIEIEPDDYLTIYVDLSSATGIDDIKLISEMKKGLKVSLKVIDPATKAVLVNAYIPFQGFEGYIKYDTLTYKYNRRGKQIGDKNLQQGNKVIYNDQEYTDNSIIPIDCNFTKIPNLEFEGLIFLELDYNYYQMNPIDNVTQLNGQQLFEELEKADKEITINHHIDYKEKYFDNPRTTSPKKVLFIKTLEKDSLEFEDYQ